MMSSPLASAQSAASHRTRVLIVEDEALIAEDLRDRLERLGYAVTSVAASAADAVAAAIDTRPDVVLMDVRLRGGSDGIEAAAAITARLDTAIVFLTAHSDAATLERAETVAPYGYLVKPISDRPLHAALSVAIHRHAVERRLRRTEMLESLGRLAGGVAHDINNMMTVVIGYAQLLQVGKLSAESRGMVDAIGHAATRSADLSRQLLAFARRQVLQPRLVNLGALIADIERALRARAGASVEFRVELPSNVWTVTVDPHQLELVLLGLVANARDAMPSGGRLTIRASNLVVHAHDGGDLPLGDYVRLSTEDTGVGMNAETQAHLFQPFFTTKPIGEGVGLGLASIHGIVCQSGGRIFVESAPGTGTTFHIDLPRGTVAPNGATH